MFFVVVLCCNVLWFTIKKQEEQETRCVQNKVGEAYKKQLISNIFLKILKIYQKPSKIVGNNLLT